MTMDYQAIIAEIEANAEADYARFELALIPGCPLPLLGVRMPYLRRMAQRLAGEWQDFALYPACATYEAAICSCWSWAMPRRRWPIRCRC